VSSPIRIDLRDDGADLEPLVSALSAGRVVVLPTDTVYGLAAAAHLPDACARVARLKGRDPRQPTALIAGSVETLFTTVLPELHGRAGQQASRLLPGPTTVIVPNPGLRFRWVCGSSPDRIGLRVPDLDPRVAAAVDRIGAVVATSANAHGGHDPATLDEVPEELLAEAAVVVDAGRHPGTPSTVVDLTAREPVVLREGALSAGDVLERLRELTNSQEPGAAAWPPRNSPSTSW
jgi:L-threonylcarbamoyladenylate synthase